VRALGLELVEELLDVFHNLMRAVVHSLPLIIDDPEKHLDYGLLYDG